MYTVCMNIPAKQLCVSTKWEGKSSSEFVTVFPNHRISTHVHMVELIILKQQNNSISPNTDENNIPGRIINPLCMDKT